MISTKHEATTLTNQPDYDRLAALKAFDETKSGVKGLVDAGVKEIPRFFVNKIVQGLNINHNLDDITFPKIDLKELSTDSDKRKNIIKQVRFASESWGFFHLVNHGIPKETLDEMIIGVRNFFEQDDEVKRDWYTRDVTKKLVYNANFDLYSDSAANWRDTFLVVAAPEPLEPEDLPLPCRYV